MNKIPVSILLLFIFISCQQKTVIEQKKEILALKEMNELATAEYSITKVVKANDNKSWFKMGDRKILLSCSGSIKAGVDLSSLKEESIFIKDKEIILTIEPAKIITLNIPPEKIKLEYEKVGFWRDKFSYAEQNELMIQAENQIKAVADSMGIIKSAESNAKQFISSFLKRLGYNSVTINFKALKKSN
jgi:Protein of unknown function (DUF4230)